MIFVFPQIMTGHGSLNTYLKRFQIKDDLLCKACGYEEDNAKDSLQKIQLYENNFKRIS